MDANVGPNFIEVAASVLTSTFQVRGKLHVLGVMQTFMNDEQKPTLSIYASDVLGIDASNPAAHMTQPEIIITKRYASIVALETMPEQGQLSLLARTEQLIMYTDRFAVAGRFHMGPDARLNDFTEASLQQFILASDVKIYPLFQSRPGLVQATPLAMIHKSQIRLYHKA